MLLICFLYVGLRVHFLEETCRHLRDRLGAQNDAISRLMQADRPDDD